MVVATNLNIDFAAGAIITVIMSSTMSPDMQNVSANIEYCWKLS